MRQTKGKEREFMKRGKYYFQIGVAVMLTLICALFLGCTIFFYIKTIQELLVCSLH